MITFRLCVLRTHSDFCLIQHIYNINGLVFITEVYSVYSAVRNDALYNTDMFRL
jgi:hypothetical protein